MSAQSRPGTFNTLRVSFTNSRRELAGELLLPSSSNRIPAAVLCHGMASDHRAMRPSAERLARSGIATLVFDFRGHGPGIEVFDGDVSDEVVSAVDFLKQVPQIDGDRIALVGHSMGASAVLLAAPRLDNLKALVSLAAPPEERMVSNSAHDMMARVLEERGISVVEYPRFSPLPWLGLFAGMLAIAWMKIRGYRLRVDWLKCLSLWGTIRASMALQTMRPIPLLFVHCQGDRVSPYETSLDLYEKALYPKYILAPKGGFHSLPLLPSKLRKAWMDWLVGILGDGPLPPLSEVRAS